MVLLERKNDVAEAALYVAAQTGKVVDPDAVVDRQALGPVDEEIYLKRK